MAEKRPDIGNWLRALREQAGMSQRDAAAATGLTERSIRRWESGEIPNGLHLLELLSAYGVKMTTAAPAVSRVDEIVAEFDRRLSAAVEAMLVRMQAADDETSAYHREVQKLRREREESRKRTPNDKATGRRRAAEG